jgi:hypothetical protein
LQAGDELLPVAGGGFITDFVDKPIRSKIVLYQTEDSKTRLEVRLENETVWLTQNQMAELFQTSIPNVSMHIRNIFREGEWQEDSVVKDLLTTAADGKRYRTNYFNLDIIRSVGYRVKSHRGSKAGLVEYALANVPSPFGIADLERLCPNVSRDIIRVVMNRRRDEGYIEVLSRGRDAKRRRLEQK